MLLAPKDRSALSSLEKTLLWSMRAWVIGVGRRLPVEEQIMRVFTKLGAADAAGQMHAFILIIGRGAERMINIDCVCKHLVSDDETLLLSVLALAQCGRDSDALILLRRMLTAAATASALDCACCVMSSLSAIGRFLEPPTDLDIAVQSMRAQTAVDYRPATLH